MRSLVLAEFGSSFATRERAREVAAKLPPGRGEITLDVTGAMLSPSFLAELLVALAAEGNVRIKSRASDDQTVTMAFRLARQLGIDEKLFPDAHVPA